MAAPGPVDDTVSAALLDCTEPAEFETDTENVSPLSETVSIGVVYDALVAPAMPEPFLRH
jgi:hypothetical protein